MVRRFFSCKIMFVKEQILVGYGPKTNLMKAMFFSALWRLKGDGREAYIVDSDDLYR